MSKVSKIAILADDRNTYVKPMADGLERMLSRIGVRTTVFYDGLQRLTALPDLFTRYVTRGAPDLKGLARHTLGYVVHQVPSMLRFLARLRSFDAIVIVQSIPTAFLRSFFKDETLRALLPNTPIVLYDLFYLPTRGPWARWLKDGTNKFIDQPGNWGLERYDWCLCASVVSETPMPAGAQPFSLIGLDLDDGTLTPDRKHEFIALIDFEYPETVRQRAVQIQACEEAAVPYIVLNGQYSISRIREIYRKTCVYFLASRESFGLPICELQACGSYVFTPSLHWCPSHWLKADLSQPGPGELSSNFILYHDDKNCLIRELQRIRANYDPQRVVDTFRRYHPQLSYGNEEELRDFVRKLRNGVINSGCHSGYEGITGMGEFPGYDPAPSLSRAA